MPAIDPPPTKPPAASLWTRRAALAALASSASLTQAFEAEAERLVQSVHERPVGRDTSSLVRMELADRGRPPRVREMVTYRVSRAKGESTSLIRFTQPKDVAGTGLLSVNRADGSSDQWLFLPALERVRRLSSDRRGGRFVGSDFYFEDLQERKPSRDRHRMLGRETLDGVACDVVESVPLVAGESAYRKRVAWIDSAQMLVQRLDLFEQDDTRPSKRWSQLSKRRDGAIWTIDRSRMADLNTGHETQLVVQRVVYDRNLPAKLFTPQALADESAELEFRP